MNNDSHGELSLSDIIRELLSCTHLQQIHYQLLFNSKTAATCRDALYTLRTELLI